MAVQNTYRSMEPLDRIQCMRKTDCHCVRNSRWRLELPLCYNYTVKIVIIITNNNTITTVNPVTHVVGWVRLADMCSNQITIQNPKETLQRKERSQNQTVRNGCLLMKHKAYGLLRSGRKRHFPCTNTLTLTPDYVCTSCAPTH